MRTQQELCSTQAPHDRSQARIGLCIEPIASVEIPFDGDGKYLVAALVPIEAWVGERMPPAEFGDIGEPDCSRGSPRTCTLDRAHDDREIAPPP
jgi:hypothetical protein